MDILLNEHLVLTQMDQGQQQAQQQRQQQQQAQQQAPEGEIRPMSESADAPIQQPLLQRPQQSQQQLVPLSASVPSLLPIRARTRTIPEETEEGG